MVKFNFRGLMAPVLTAFNNDSTKSINLKIIPEYAHYLAKAGVTGILVNGTSGEGMSLSIVEREAVTEAWEKACAANRQYLMVQIGGVPMPEVLRLARHAEALKVGALLCLPELFNKPKTAEELVTYLQHVSRAAPNTPLLYYHLPAWTNVNINMPEFLDKAYGKIGTFVGIKFTSNDLNEGTACLTAGRGSFTIFLGADQIMAGAFTQGFDSAIATSLNMLAGSGQKILSHIKANNAKEAREAQQELTAAINIITRNGTWVPTMKAAMDLLTPIKVGPPRPPLIPLTEKQIEQMQSELSTTVLHKK